MTDELATALLDAVVALRADLKRREQRDLEHANRIPPSRAPANGGATSAPTGLPTALPSYGRKSGQPIVGADLSDLEWYAKGCRRTLDDPGKARFHDRERLVLQAITAEIDRQSGGASGGEAAPDFGGGGLDEEVPF